MGCLKFPSAGPYPRAVFQAGSPTFPCPQASATLHHPIFWPYQSPCGHFDQIFKKKGENSFDGPGATPSTQLHGYNPLGCPRKDAGARKGLAEHLLGWRTSVTTSELHRGSHAGSEPGPAQFTTIIRASAHPVAQFLPVFV